NHNHATSIEFLKALIDQSSENISGLFLEGDISHAEVYQHLGSRPERTADWEMGREAPDEFCNAQFAYESDQLFPLIRRHNSQRTTPLEIIPIDSWNEITPGTLQDGLLLGDCRPLVLPGDPTTIHTRSLDREMQTAKNFLHQVHERWRPGQ